MLLYNITFSVEKRIHENWLKWMKAHFVPEIEKISQINNHSILKLLTEIDNGGVTYTFQLFFENQTDYEHFETNQREMLLYRHDSFFRGKVMTFNTLLETV